jgi:CRISPR system Cascade subunit CasB
VKTDEKVYNAVKYVLNRLSPSDSAYQSTWAKAMLAKLRRAAGSEPSSSPDIWEITAGIVQINGSERQKCAEHAVHLALTLYGTHQQSKDESMSCDKIGFGAAVRMLAPYNSEKEDSIRRRFNAFAKSEEYGELTARSRGLVQLMRNNGIGFDYPQFAEELYIFMIAPEKRSDIRMSWARGFYSAEKNNSKDDNGGNENG